MSGSVADNGILEHAEQLAHSSSLTPALPPTGLLNIGGNSCYMNATIQMLRHTYPILHFFVSDACLQFAHKSRKESVFLHKWHALLAVFASTKDKQPACTISPKYFMQAAKECSLKLAVKFADGQQHDIVDFMQFCLDQLHASTAMKVSMVTEGDAQNREDEMMVQSYNAFRTHFESEYSVIIEMFAGQFFQSMRTCDDDVNMPFKCSESYDPFTILSLPIPFKKQTCRLKDCLDLFVAAETIQGWKPTDQSPPRLAQKFMKLWALPTILVIQLKRFVGFQHKDNRAVDIPLELDLAEYCHGYDRRSAQYRLYAVGNHIGGVSSGHYTADCQDFKTKGWVNYNDATVHKHGGSYRPNERTAYLLMYQRVSN